MLFKGTPFDLEDINLYATGIGFQDTIIWNYEEDKATDTLQKTKDLGMLVHIWTFKDDILLFKAPTNIVIVLFI